MRRQIEFWGLMALLAGASGCATTAQRDDGTSIFGPRAWNAPPAPPQRLVKLTADTTVLPTDNPTLRQRLAGSLSSLSKKPTGPPPAAGGTPTKAPEPPAALASTQPKTTWFGLRSHKPVQPTTYMTDARAQLNKPAPVPTTLPVALQVPSAPPQADRMVTPTATSAPTDPPSVTQGVVIGAAASAIPDFGGKPSAAGEDEVNPLPPAAEPGTQAALFNRMAKTPAVDPVAPKTATEDRDSKPGSPDSDESTILVAGPPPEANGQAAPTPPTSEVMPASSPMIPTASRQAVLASPQGPPPMPTSQAKPSPQVKPSPQGAAGPAKTWRRPCLRRLVRRVWHLGEFADPPTAAPH